ncbi:MAG TPA: hypothetical protein P5511_06945, partial [Candidatus Goldiibacteriota bacterium]|nr:hypothetical protein [Candidatus Goldiibacteriota bacterium]
ATYTVYGSVDTKLGNSGWFPSLYVSFDTTPYRNQQVINDKGLLSSGLRTDSLITAEIRFPYFADDVTGAGIGYTLLLKSSNQNYYDSLGTLAIADDVFTENYYSYTGHRISLNVTYETDIRLFNSYKPVISIGFDAEGTGYTSRKAKDVSGKYTGVNQSDYNYNINAEFRHKLADFWSYYVNFKFARFGSNMKWEAYGTYNYTYVMLSLGTALSF